VVGRRCRSSTWAAADAATDGARTTAPTSRATSNTLGDDPDGRVARVITLFSATRSISLSGFRAPPHPLVIGSFPRSLSAMITITGMDADAEPTEPERVLVVTAHPDDVDFGAAGTVARLTRAGCTVSYAIVTDGDAGELPEGTDRFAGGALRRREQLAAATEVGVRGDDVHFLGFTDGMVEDSGYE
jgi:hypothetical protein